MLQKYTGVVLHLLRYTDQKHIVHIYTCESGHQSFLIPAQRSRKSRIHPVLFRPLSLIAFEAEVRGQGRLPAIREARACHVLQTLPYDPYKSAIALFLAEFLWRALKEESVNLPLYAYLEHSIRWLDACTTSYANFHLVFLMRLSRFLGLYPNLEHYVPGAYFDLLNACFTCERPVHGMFVRPEEAVHLRNLMRMKYETMHLFGMSRTERNRCLEIIGSYYRLHLPGFPDLKSPDVLQELFQ